jgi:L-ascorbate metabolism protein UlaG (beta-lactamase superfamily)
MKVFGKNPSGTRLEKIRSAPNYQDESFRNLEKTEVMLKGVSMVKLMKDFINKSKATEPPSPLPSVKTDLHSIRSGSTQLVWFGHSSYLIASNGFTILVDPVFSGNASPFTFFAKAFRGSNNYSVDDMPDIDLLLLTHDHYDHLDYSTVRQIDRKVKKVVTSLGVGQHLEYWKISPSKITELNWWQETIVDEQVKLTATPARHFSGRGTRRGKTLWSSFVLELFGTRIFVGGDSGYDKSFHTIGEKFGPFELAILENGQYNKNWPYIHMMPEQAVLAAKDLNAEWLLPVHWGKFALSLHEWNEPAKRVVNAARESGQKIITPRIGELVTLGENRSWPEWWEM